MSEGVIGLLQLALFAAFAIYAVCVISALEREVEQPRSRALTEEDRGDG